MENHSTSPPPPKGVGADNNLGSAQFDNNKQGHRGQNHPSLLVEKDGPGTGITKLDRLQNPAEKLARNVESGGDNLGENEEQLDPNRPVTIDPQNKKDNTWASTPSKWTTTAPRWATAASKWTTTAPTLEGSAIKSGQDMHASHTVAEETPEDQMDSNAPKSSTTLKDMFVGRDF